MTGKTSFLVYTQAADSSNAAFLSIYHTLSTSITLETILHAGATVPDDCLPR
jgi:hypothetical protein